MTPAVAEMGPLVEEKTRLLVHHMKWGWRDGRQVSLRYDRLGNGIVAMLDGRHVLRTVEIDEALALAYTVSFTTSTFGVSLPMADIVAWFEQHEEQPDLSIDMLSLAESLGVLSHHPAVVL